VQTFKKKLLKELGFSSVPNISAFKAVKFPPIYAHLVEAENSKLTQQSEEDEDDFHAKTKRIFLFPEEVASVTRTVGKSYIFKTNSEHSNLKVKAATLWLHIAEQPNSVGSSSHDLYHFSVYKGYKPPGKDVLAKELYRSEIVNVTGWYSVKVSAAVKEWFSINTKFDLSFDVAINGTKSIEVDRQVNGAEIPLQPFLAVDTEEKKNRNRRRRAAEVDIGDCDSKSPNTCCRHNLVVDFDKISWDFVISPRSVNIYACAGICESMVHHLSQRRGMAFRQLKLGNACCGPKRMAPLTLLYVSNSGEGNKVVVKKIPDMRVLSCRCLV